MPLTTSQLQAIKTHIDASNDLNVFANNSDGNFAVAALLNITASPDFVVWRTAVTWDEIMLNGMDWARVDNLSVGKSRIWDWMFQNTSRSMNPSRANIRTGIEAVWVGTAADLAVRAAVYAHCKRNATRVENVLSTGTGTTNDPAVTGMPDGWRVSANEVEAARNLA